MSNYVFWDTFAYIALGNKRDSLHSPAVYISKQLARKDARIITTSAILTEFANAFSKIGLRGTAQKLVESTYESARMGVVKLVHVDEVLWNRGWQLYQERPDKEWGLTDCISFVVMNDFDIVEAFTADHHFEQAGFVRLLQN